MVDIVREMLAYGFAILSVLSALSCKKLLNSFIENVRTYANCFLAKFCNITAKNCSIVSKLCRIVLFLSFC